MSYPQLTVPLLLVYHIEGGKVKWLPIHRKTKPKNRIGGGKNTPFLTLYTREND